MAELAPAELLRRFGADPAGAQPRTSVEAVDLQHTWTTGYRPVVRIGSAGQWRFGFEQGHAEGLRVEALRRLSAGTQAVAVHFGGQHTELALARDGVLITGYDSRRADRRGGRQPDLLLRALRRARLVPLDEDRYPDEDVRAVLEILATELGIALHGGSLAGGSLDSGPLDGGPLDGGPLDGGPLDGGPLDGGSLGDGSLGDGSLAGSPAGSLIESLGELLAGPLVSAQYLPALADPVPARRRYSVRTEPEIVTALAYASQARLRPALLGQARRLAAETGLADYAEVSAALEAADPSTPTPVHSDSALGVRIRTLALEAAAAVASRADPAARGLLTEPERRAWQRRLAAATAIAGVLSCSPHAAAQELLHRRQDPHWRAELMADLAGVDLPADAVERVAAAEQMANRPVSAATRDRTRQRRPQRPMVGPGAPMRLRPELGGCGV